MIAFHPNLLAGPSLDFRESYYFGTSFVVSSLIAREIPSFIETINVALEKQSFCARKHLLEKNESFEASVVFGRSHRKAHQKIRALQWDRRHSDPLEDPTPIQRTGCDNECRLLPSGFFPSVLCKRKVKDTFGNVQKSRNYNIRFTNWNIQSFRWFRSETLLLTENCSA